jgi:glycosyltransferase involved in cell wall biosynthesis
MSELPVISIITPCFNAELFLEDTIYSILSQGYPKLEYYIIDAGSTDKTIEIIKKFEHHLSGWISEKDRGMYDALNKGFARTKGEIMTWLNADDLMLPNSLNMVADIFTQLPSVKWITGLPCKFDLSGRLVSVYSNIPKWSKYRYLKGDFKWISQEGVFWHRELWEKTGSRLDSKLKYAGDLELWSRFFEHAELVSVDTPLAGMRIRGQGQLSYDYHQDYCQEAQISLKTMLAKSSSQDRKRCRLIVRREATLKLLRKLQIINTSAYAKHFIEPEYLFPKNIHFNHEKQKYELRSKYPI